MTIILKSAGDATAFNLRRLSRLVTDRTNLVGEFIFGRNIASSVQNSASDTAADGLFRFPGASAPTFGDHYVPVGGTTWFDPQLFIPEDFTVILIIRPGASATNDAYLVNGGASVSFTALLMSGTSLRGQYYQTSGGASVIYAQLATTPASPFTDWRAIAIRMGDYADPPTIAVSHVKNGDTFTNSSTLNAYTPSGGRVADNRRSLCIGGAQGYQVGATFDVAGALYYDAVLSDADVEDAMREALASIAAMGGLV